MKRKIKLAKNESHHDESNWLISYADMMTLLWGFFVILSAISVPDKKLIEKLKESTSKSLGGEYNKPFNELSDELIKVLTELNLQNEAQIDTLSDGVKLTIKSTKFFESGSFDLSEESKQILIKVGSVLKKQDDKFKILVEGHTDDVPMKKSSLISNWELSSNRAVSVVKLFESIGIKHDNLRPVGLSDVEPGVSFKELSGVELESARAKNRRIVIRLIKTENKRIKSTK